jgi:hypothetical protein
MFAAGAGDVDALQRTELLTAEGTRLPKAIDP